MADEIRVDYPQLQQVAAQFARQATAVNQTQQRVKRQVGQLRSAWVGKGSGAFYAEMNDKVLPATERLYRALQEASKTTRQIAQLMEQAENDAAAPFKAGEKTGGEEGSTPAQPRSAVLPVAAPFIIAVVALPVIGIVSNISRGWSASKSEKNEISTAQEALRAIKGLKPDEWSKLDVAGRMTVLRQVEEALAKAQGRPAMQIESADFTGNKLGEYNGSVLKIDEDALKGNDLHGILEIVAHEGRHAYQDYAIQHPGFHPDTEQVNAWRDNSGDKYQRAEEVGMKRYWNQPVEQDARHFADQFADTVAPQSIFMEVLDEAGEVVTGVMPV